MRIWLTMASAALLGGGGAVYVLFRPSGLLLFRVLGALGAMPAVKPARLWAAGISRSDFVAFSLPGGLWAAAWVVLMVAFFGGRGNDGRLLRWASVVPVLGAGSEFMQGAAWLPGTADAIDLLCYVVPYAMLVLLMFFCRTRNKMNY